jgi:trimeric autotransporter adhesin
MNQPIEFKATISVITKSTIHSGAVPRWGMIAVLLVCFCFLPKGQAINPPPDGGYPGGNTAEGQNALLGLTSGTFNTAVGFLSLTNDTAGQFNTAVGAGALFANVGDSSSGVGVENTATGAAALLSNTTGFANTADGAFDLLVNSTGSFNTANGVDALRTNITGNSNTAIGADALFSNTIGTANTAIGARALFSSTVGTENTANGFNALQSNITGNSNTGIGFNALMSNTAGTNNTANGVSALSSNTTGGGNVAVGTGALFHNDIGNTNTALGDSALASNLATDNTAVGADAGFVATTGRGNVYIGAEMTGVADESEHTYIRNINTTNVSGGGTDTVTVNLATGLLGHLTSSRRYKEDIKPIDDASEVLYRLNPVSYRYKREIDSTQSPAFGLIAEEVAEVDPALVAHNSGGQPESVHYEMVNAMLLNKFLKEHRAVQELKSVVAKQEAAAAEQQKQIEALTAVLQKVNAQLATASPSLADLK